MLTISSLYAMTMPGQTQEGVKKWDQLATFSKHVFTVAIVVLIAADKLTDFLCGTITTQQESQGSHSAASLQKQLPHLGYHPPATYKSIQKGFQYLLHNIMFFTPLSHLFLSFKFPFKNFSKELTKNLFSRTNEIASWRSHTLRSENLSDLNNQN